MNVIIGSRFTVFIFTPYKIIIWPHISSDFFSDLWHRKLRDIKNPVNIMVINDVSKVENCNDVYSLYTFNRVDIYIYIFSSEGG